MLTASSVTTQPGTTCPERRILAGVVDGTGSPPRLRYVGNVLAENTELGLAVVRLVADATGAAPRDLPAAVYGDSDAVTGDDRLTVLGFAGATGEGVTVTVGEVAAFQLQGDGITRALITTGADVARGVVGGAVFDPRGRLVAVPVATRDAQTGTARLRPSNLARPLLDAAAATAAALPPLGVDPLPGPPATLPPTSTGPTSTGPTTVVPTSTGPTTVVPARHFEAKVTPGKTPGGEPLPPETAFPAGVAQICVFWRYADMVDGLPYRVEWDVGTTAYDRYQGTWRLGASGRGANWCRPSPPGSARVPSGDHRFRLFVNGTPALDVRFRVG